MEPLLLHTPQYPWHTARQDCLFLRQMSLAVSVKLPFLQRLRTYLVPPTYCFLAPLDQLIMDRTYPLFHYLSTSPPKTACKWHVCIRLNGELRKQMVEKMNSTVFLFGLVMGSVALGTFMMFYAMGWRIQVTVPDYTPQLDIQLNQLLQIWNQSSAHELPYQDYITPSDSAIKNCRIMLMEKWKFTLLRWVGCGCQMPP